MCTRFMRGEYVLLEVDRVQKKFNRKLVVASLVPLCVYSKRTDFAFSELSILLIYAVAFEVGFNSKSTFYKAFKEIKGANPTAYIKRMESSENA
ncbi:MAG: hypothetical protein AAFQ20_15005, partial [Bacteroidota bacterium]